MPRCECMPLEIDASYITESPWMGPWIQEQLSEEMQAPLFEVSDVRNQSKERIYKSLSLLGGLTPLSAKEGSAFYREFTPLPFTAVYSLLSSTRQRLNNASVGVTSPIEHTFNKLSLDHVKIPEPAEIRRYLVHHPDLVDILPGLCTTIGQRFAKDIQISLEFYRGPAPGEGYLTIYVRQQQYDDRILNLIDEIHEEYRDALDEREGWLVITTDFRPPR